MSSVSKIRQYAEEGFTRKEIANQIGIRYDTVKKLCRTHNIEPVGKSKVSVDTIRQCAKEGLTKKEIASQIGAAYSTVIKICRDHKIETPNGKTRRSNELISVIQQYAEKGYTKKEIASQIGLAYNTVSDYCRAHNIITTKKYVKTKEQKPKKPTEKAKRIIELRKQGKSYDEIKNVTGISKRYISQVCQKNNSGGKIRTLNNSIEYVKDIVKQSGFEYVKGYEQSHSVITVRCPQCNKTFKRQYDIFVKHINGTQWGCKNIYCPHCRKTKRDAHLASLAKAKEEKERKIAEGKAMKESRAVNKDITDMLAIHVCKTCGREFCLACTNYKSKTYCSEYCQVSNYRKQHDSARYKRMYSRKHDNDITLKKVYKHDKGICYLCGKRCDWKDCERRDGAFIAGNNFPSIDHVIPLSKGGTHTWDNVRLACRVCNARKADK